jgi:hypothetical protein
MKAKDVAVGVKVQDVCNYPVKNGIIIGTKLSDGDAVVAVEWSNGSLAKVNIADLSVIDPLLERDFHDIAAKIAKAALLIGEANVLARNHKTDLSSLAYNYDEHIDHGVSALFTALNNAGWNSSSMSC